jgi:transcriptional regulator with XRE-family HTH domain
MAELVKIANARDHAASGAGRLIRLASNISLREMAGAIRVDPSTLLRWERGERRPTGAAAERWVDELNRLAERDKPRRRTPDKRTPGLAGHQGVRADEHAQSTA